MKSAGLLTCKDRLAHPSSFFGLSFLAALGKFQSRSSFDSHGMLLQWPLHLATSLKVSQRHFHLFNGRCRRRHVVQNLSLEESQASRQTMTEAVAAAARAQS